MSTHAKEAFLWIVDILEKNKIPFQIAGGLAATYYGATRDLYDIDIDIPEESFKSILLDVAPYVTFGPTRLKDRELEIYLLTLSYNGQLIDIGGAHKTKIFNAARVAWERLSVDFAQAEQGSIYGKVVPIIPRSALIQYKSILNRDVDRLDLLELLEVPK